MSRYIILDDPRIFIDTHTVAINNSGRDSSVTYYIKSRKLYEVRRQTEIIDYQPEIGGIYQERTREICLGRILRTSNNLETIINKIVSSGIGRVTLERAGATMRVTSRVSKRDLDTNRDWEIHIELNGTELDWTLTHSPTHSWSPTY